MASSEHLILISKIDISFTLIHEQILCTYKKILTCLSAPVTIVSRFLSSHFKNGLNSSRTTPADISSACFVFVHSSREVSINLKKEPIHELTTIFTLGNSIIYSLAFKCYEQSSLPIFIVLKFVINKIYILMTNSILWIKYLRTVSGRCCSSGTLTLNICKIKTNHFYKHKHNF